MYLNSALTKQVVGTIYDDLVKYYGIYGFIKYKIKALQEKPYLITNNDVFWSLVLKDNFMGDYDKDRKLLSGQVLTFSNNFYLSEWAPKIPGRIWTKTGQKLYNEAFEHQMVDEEWKWKKKYEIIFDESGKKKAMEAGFGSVRINPSKNPNETFMYMSLTTSENWDIDSAIPVIVSKGVFEEYRRKSVNNGAVEIGKLEGILILDMDLPISETISSALGVQLDKKLADTLTKQPFLPKCFVYIPSLLGVDFKYNNSHPQCTGWTMYKKKAEQDWDKNYNQKENFEYGITYNCFYPTHPESLVEAVDFMKDYAEYNNGAEIITDFDGMEPKFESRLSIATNPQKTQTSIFKATLEEVTKFAQSIP